MDLSSKPTLDFLRARNQFLLDLDGVVYQGKTPLPGAVRAVSWLRSLGKRVGFLTNNSGQNPQKICEKLRSMGIPCEHHEILTSGEASVLFLKESQLDQGKGVFVVGTDDLKGLLQSQGLQLADSKSCGAVLVGYDPHFDYSTLTEALQGLVRGVPFVACNRDSSFPMDGGKLLPGCGAMVGALEGAASRKADYEIGKPNPYMARLLMKRLEIHEEDCVIVGDSLDSDIRMANAIGIPSIWISDQFENSLQNAFPDFRVPYLADLVPNESII